ncbi:MAG: LamG domain-containing protein [Candidatus Pacebacteria bacterium]|nr:LamG domain-containing protein [Candidatus Paceibacterota bacterium]
MNKSFTLIEILVVIVIIGILSAFIIVSMAGVSSKANIAKGQAFSNSLRNSLLMNLISEWKLDEGTGTSVADSWSGNTGTLLDSSGNPCSTSYCPQWKTGTHCVKGSCLLFDGNSDYVNLLNNNGSLNINPPFTLEFWVKPLGGEINQSLWGGFTDNGNTKNFIRVGSNLNICLDQWPPSGGNPCWGDALSLNQWNHIAVSQTSSSLSLYINGNFASYGTVEVYAGATPDQWNIGRRWISPSGSNYFNGYVDEVRIYSAIVPTSRIREQHYSGLNKLLANNEMKKQEYSQKINQLASN